MVKFCPVIIFLVGITNVFADKVHGGKICKCKRENEISVVYDKNDAVFWATVTKKFKFGTSYRHKATVIPPHFKGCLNEQITIASDVECPVQLHNKKTYLIAASREKKYYKISKCSYIREKKVDVSEWAHELHWLGHQMSECENEITCFDGSIPFNCKPCPSLIQIKEECSLAVKCRMNKCGGCNPEYYDKDEKRVCHRCPLGLQFLECPEESSLCNSARPPTCDEANDSDVYCVSGSCGTCSALWIDEAGTEVCKGGSFFHQCKDLMLVNFGNCKKSLGFGVLKNKCSNIVGCSSTLSLFQSKKECLQTCKGMNQEKGKNETKTCTPGSDNCCEDGTPEDVCIYSNLKKYCEFVKCGDIKHKECTADPCNKCKVQMRDRNRDVIDLALCELDLPEYKQCTENSIVKCPPDLIPDCGSLPLECPSDWNARCVIDPCSCKSIWMNEDIRQTTDECLRALMADCVLEQDCPLEFECKPSREELRKEDGFAEGFEIQCIQKACTCVPMWHMYDIEIGPSVAPGHREKCKKFENCCDKDEFYKKKNCSRVIESNLERCKNMTCRGKGIIDLSTCESDPCDDCNLKVNYMNGNPVKLETCDREQLQENCRFDPTIKCPKKKPKCPDLPASCPKDLNKRCIMDPCVCKPRWVNLDVRFIPETCKMGLEPPCIPYDECPSLPCLPIPQNIQEEMSQEELDNYVCLPEPCSCWPMFVPNFYGYS